MVNLSDYYKHQISVERENLGISHEYNAMDWTRFFFGKFNQLFRWINRGSVQVKMEGVEVYVEYLTGGATTFGRILNIAGDSVDSFMMPFIAGIPNIIKYFNTMDSNTKGLEILKQVPNIYNLLYNKTDKINWQSPEQYKELLDLNKKMIGQLNTVLQLPNWRAAYTNELNALKLIRPKEVENDIRKFEVAFNMNMDKLDPKTTKQWEAVIKEANEFARGIIKTILDNVRDGGGYINHN